jgi:hypothetical protein
VRGIAAFGQRTQLNGQKADGLSLLVENSLISRRNWSRAHVSLFAGFGRPQSLRNGDAGSILFNTGILLETDGLTGFPLDDTAHDTYGGAVGVNICSISISRCGGRDRADTRRSRGPGDQSSAGSAPATR